MVTWRRQSRIETNREVATSYSGHKATNIRRTKTSSTPRSVTSPIEVHHRYAVGGGSEEMVHLSRMISLFVVLSSCYQ